MKLIERRVSPSNVERTYIKRSLSQVSRAAAAGNWKASYFLYYYYVWDLHCPARLPLSRSLATVARDVLHSER